MIIFARAWTGSRRPETRIGACAWARRCFVSGSRANISRKAATASANCCRCRQPPLPRKLARAVFAAGVLASEQGEMEAADALMMESLVIARQLGDQQGAAVSLNARAVHARDQGRLALAHSLFQESLALWKELGDLKAMARALSNLASVLKMQGEFELARSLCGECLAIFQGLGDRTGVAWSLNNQGDVERDSGNSEAARAR